MQIGKLNRRVSIEQRQTGQDTFGQPLLGWSLVGAVWADIRLLNGREFIRSDAEVSRATVSIRIRYRSDLTAGMRVVHGTELYSIEAILPDVAGRDHLDLVCSIGANDG